MGINRRQFGALLATSLFAPQLFATQGKPLIASAAQNREGGHCLVMLNTVGQEIWSHPLPARAHHVEAHPAQPVIAVIGRRPETFIDILDYQQQRLIKRVHAEAGQHFYGHAVFSSDGRFLLSAENDITTGNGMISVRDVYHDYKIIGQFHSGGIGPHELKMMSDRKTLLVANGGILTHPDQGRAKLNLDSMQPSLAYIDLASGRVIEQVYMPEELQQLSIRHFDINPKDRVAIGLQYQGDKRDDVPLVAFHSRGEALRLVRAPAAVNSAMKQYCGSVRFDKSGEFVAISSPRGNLITFWDQGKSQYIDKISSRDGCGIARTYQPGEFLISTGRGHCYRYNLLRQEREKLSLTLNTPIAWDNHLLSFY